MARKRMIDPSFWDDEKLGECEPVVRLLFMGLISQADDEGRLKGHPSLLRSNIFPYDELTIMADAVDGWLAILEEHKLIRRYEVGRQKYIDVPNFKKHQTINKPQKSKLPEYYGSTTVVVTEDDGIDPVQKKLKEEKLKEEEVKAKLIESSTEPVIVTHSTYNDPIKDKLHDLITKCKIKSYNIIAADDIFFFIGKMDIEVIELAIKKAFEKHLNYAVNTLLDWMKEGKVKIEDHKPQVGDSDAKKHEGQLQHERAAAEDKPITGGAVGWLPSKARDYNVIHLSNVSG